jgi:hypothetical protein
MKNICISRGNLLKSAAAAVPYAITSTALGNADTHPTSDWRCNMLCRLLQFTLAANLAVTWVATVDSRESSAAPLRITQENATISVFNGDRLVFRYRYVESPKKPYADRLLSPDGVQILRDSPGDHKHHHGLMYALAVDQVNFWEEDQANSGSEVHKRIGNVKATVGDGVARAGFVQELDWVGPTSPKPLLVERRAIDVLETGDSGATLIGWRCCLQAPPGKEQMHVGGHHYYGLGLRFLVSMDFGGRFLYSVPNAHEVVHGDECLTPARWCAYTAKADGKLVTAALFDHPANLRHPARMFTMQTPFAYLSATMNEWKEPITVKSAEPLNLCYGVALWDGEPDRTTIEALYQHWLKLVSTLQ